MMTFVKEVGEPAWGFEMGEEALWEASYVGEEYSWVA